MNGKKVLIGLSGGVDSSVAAYLLKEQGYEVVGVTLKLLQDASEIDDAKLVCEKLGIEHIVVDMSAQFKKLIVDNFASEYAAGRTPNPCLRCNRYIKWAGLLKAADELGADFIATGHYARLVSGDGSQPAAEPITTSSQDVSLLHSSSSKDQTYALCMVSREQLSRTLMPLADYTKEEVREIAARVGLPTASKSDSMDICFVPDGDYAKFLAENYPDRFGGEAGPGNVEACAPGNFVNSRGEVLGTHKGIAHYTVGQRRGLGISADRSLYVIRINPEANEVVLGYEEEVYSNTLVAENVNWLIEPPQKPIEVIAKIRYNHKGAKAVLEPIGRSLEGATDNGEGTTQSSEVKVTFAEPQKAITPGQAAVFYVDGRMIGGGTIK